MVTAALSPSPETTRAGAPVKQPRSRLRSPVVWAVLLSTCFLVLCYVGSCGFPRLLDQIDAQYAGGAREMISRHGWLIPTHPRVTAAFGGTGCRCDLSARLPDCPPPRNFQPNGLARFRPPGAFGIGEKLYLNIGARIRSQPITPPLWRCYFHTAEK
jgi:hypothetical protein